MATTIIRGTLKNSLCETSMWSDFMTKLEEIVDSSFILPSSSEDVVSDDDNVFADEISRLQTTTSTILAGVASTSSEGTSMTVDFMADIAVWVNGREKILTGVSRSTTCQDIVRTLLENELKVDKVPRTHAQNYALYERWRDCERPLAQRARVYKLWKAWGNEQENVKFTMKKCSASNKDGSPMKGGSRAKARKDNAKRQSVCDRDPAKGLSMRRCTDNVTRNVTDKRKVRDKGHDLLLVAKSEDSTGSSEAEFVSSDVCGPEVIGTDNANSLPDALMNLTSTRMPSVDTFNHLFQLVLQQSQQLEELLENAQCIDREIEFYETKMHLLRVEENGKNYVQDAYLAHHDGDSTESKMAEIIASMYETKGSSELEAYIDLYERILRVEDQLCAKRSTISTLSRQLERERADCVQSQRPVPTATDDILTFGSTVAEQMSMKSPTVYHNTLREGYCEQESAERKITLKSVSCMESCMDCESSRSPDHGLTSSLQLENSTLTLVAQRTEISTMQNQLLSVDTLLDDKCDWMNVLTGELMRLEETEAAMISSLPSSVEVTSVEPDERSEKRLQELLQLVRQPLQPIQEIPEEDIGQFPDGMQIAANEEMCMNKKIISDDSSDTGLSSLHSQDDQYQFFEIISETLV